MRQRAPDDQEVDPEEIRLPPKIWHERPITELLNPLANVSKEEADRLYSDIGTSIKERWDEMNTSIRPVAENLIKAATTLPKNLTDEEWQAAMDKVIGMQKGIKSLGADTARAIRDFSIINTVKHTWQSFKEMKSLLDQGYEPSHPEVVKRSTDVAGAIMSGTSFSQMAKTTASEVAMGLEKHQSVKALDEAVAQSGGTGGWNTFKGIIEIAKKELDVDITLNKKGEIIVKHPSYNKAVNVGKDYYDLEEFLTQLEQRVQKHYEEKVKAGEDIMGQTKHTAKQLKQTQTEMKIDDLHQQYKDGFINSDELKTALDNLYASDVSKPATKDMSGVKIQQDLDGSWKVVGPGAIDGGSTHQVIKFGKGKEGHLAATEHYSALEKLPQGGKLEKGPADYYKDSITDKINQYKQQYEDGLITAEELGNKVKALGTPDKKKGKKDPLTGKSIQEPYFVGNQKSGYTLYDELGNEVDKLPTKAEAQEALDALNSIYRKALKEGAYGEQQGGPTKAQTLEKHSDEYKETGHTSTGENKPFIVEKMDGNWVLFNKQGNIVGEFGKGKAGKTKAQEGYDIWMKETKSNATKNFDPTAQFDVQLVDSFGKPYGNIHKGIDWKGLTQYQEGLAGVLQAHKNNLVLGAEEPLTIKDKSGQKYKVWYTAESAEKPSSMGLPTLPEKLFPDAKSMEKLVQGDEYKGPVIGYHARREGRMDAIYRETGEYKFDLERSKDLGIHFGTRRQANSMAGTKPDARVISAKIDTKNTFDMDGMFNGYNLSQQIAERHPEYAKQIEKLTGDMFKHIPDRPTMYEGLRKILDKLGYDSVRYWNTIDDPYKGGYSYIVWKPGTVKSGYSPDKTLYSNKGLPITPQQANPDDKEGWLYQDYVKPFLDYIAPDRLKASRDFKEMRQQYFDMVPDRLKQPTRMQNFLQAMDEATDGQFKYAVGVLPGVRVRIPNPITVHHTSPVGGIQKFRTDLPLSGEGSAISGDGIYLAESAGVRDYYKYKVFEGRRGQHGYRYDVNIHANDADLLHFDRPLSGQGDIVKNAFPESMHNMTGIEAYEAVKAQIAKDQGLRPRSKELGLATAEMFANRGLVGGKFLDKYSRPGGPTAGNPTHNYVIWVPEILEITKRYGIAVGAGGAGIPLLRGAKSDEPEEQ